MNIPHNEHKHNSKHLSLQPLGNLAYHNGKGATSYDGVNSLTTYNNNYTLLYPDLVQELFNFLLYNSNIITNTSYSLGSLDKNLHKYSSLDASLSPRDILFFLQIVSLYQLELSKGNASITYPSLKLAKILGIDVACDATSFDSISNSSHSSSTSNMRSTILKMTAKLESLGLLKVFRRKKSNGMDMANKLIPVIPDRLHARIKDSPVNLKVSDSSKLDHESNLDHILRTKLFVPIELEFMKGLFKDSMPSKYKLFFLNCIISAYRNFRCISSTSFKQVSRNSNSRAEKDTNSVCCDSRGNLIDLTNKLSFSATSRELMKKNNISRSTLDRIFRYVKQQGDSFFLKVEHKYTKSDDIDCNRYDKSIFVISINPLVFPISQIRQSQKEEISNINHNELQCANSSIFPDTYDGFETAWSKKQPSIIIKTALNNKDIIIKESNKDIDVKNEELDKLDENNQIKPQTFLQTSNSEHLESELCSLSSKSLKNSIKDFMDSLPPLSHTNSENVSSTIQDISDRKNKINIENNFDILTSTKTESQTKASNDNQNKELRHFYPLSEKDISLLNSRANREFSNNFVNQLLLKLYIKYPEKRFKNSFTFLSYMVQILQNEKHQGPLVNHTSFRFSCNIGTEEKNLLEYEKYLSEIENSLDTSKEMSVKKKIAGRFSTEVAYKILTKVQFKTNHDNSFITALIPNNLALSERQIEILSEQLEAVYGINGYYVQDVEEKIPPPKSKTSDIDFDGTPIDILGGSSEIDMTGENTTWHKIRKGLIEELGEAIDTAWFSKAVVKECSTTSTLTITMPTRFMSDFIKSRYSYDISRIARVLGVIYIEYKSS